MLARDLARPRASRTARAPSGGPWRRGRAGPGRAASGCCQRPAALERPHDADRRGERRRRRRRSPSRSGRAPPRSPSAEVRVRSGSPAPAPSRPSRSASPRASVPADRRAEVEDRREREDEPAEGRGLPVRGAPAPGTRGEVQAIRRPLLADANGRPITASSSVDRAERAPRSRRRRRTRVRLVAGPLRRGLGDSAASRPRARRSRAAARSPPRRRQLARRRSPVVARRSPSPKRATASGTTCCVEARARAAGRARSSRRAAGRRSRRAPAPSRERGRARRARAPRPACAAPRESSSRASRSCGASTTRGRQRAISAAPSSAQLVALRVVALAVERLGAVRERVQRGPDGLGARQVERQADVVDDRGRVRAAAAADDPPVGRANAVDRSSTPRPSTSSAPRRAAGPLCAEAALPVSIAEPPPTASEPVRLGRRPRSASEGTSVHQPTCGRSSDAAQRAARDQERPLDAELGERRRAARRATSGRSRQPLAREVDERAGGAASRSGPLARTSRSRAPARAPRPAPRRACRRRDRTRPTSAR